MAVKQISELPNATLSADSKFVVSPANSTSLSSIKDYISKEIQNTFCPIGTVYIQYPMQKTPSEMYGFGTWQDISSLYRGLFLRVAGGNAESFSHTLSVVVSGTTVSLPNGHGVTTSHILLDTNTGEQREVSAVSGNVATISSAFSSNVTNVLVIQRETLPNIRGEIGSIIPFSQPKDAVIPMYVTPSLTGGENYGTIRVLFEASLYNRTYRNNAQVRPNNLSIKIWKRIS